MKINTIRTEKQCTRLKGWEAEAFFQRIRTDANHSIITNFRDEASATRITNCYFK